MQRSRRAKLSRGAYAIHVAVMFFVAMNSAVVAANEGPDFTVTPSAIWKADSGAQLATAEQGLPESLNLKGVWTYAGARVIVASRAHVASKTREEAFADFVNLAREAIASVGARESSSDLRSWPPPGDEPGLWVDKPACRSGST